jgi:hypothetical protein
MVNDRPEHRLFDVRLRNRLLAAGVLSQKDVEKFESKLPDLADAADTSDVQLESGGDAGPNR